MFIVSPCRQGRPVSVLLGGSGINGITKRVAPVSGALLMSRVGGEVCRPMHKEVVPKPYAYDQDH